MVRLKRAATAVPAPCCRRSSEPAWPDRLPSAATSPAQDPAEAPTAHFAVGPTERALTRPPAPRAEGPKPPSTPHRLVGRAHLVVVRAAERRTPRSSAAASAGIARGRFERVSAAQKPKCRHGLQRARSSR
jgi:hypothetical protein